ncbi:MAG TPA: serine/threonine-protein kinase, partial [Urbifossiella sp.]|nr:serine/threonine-protein kinase [Urbifossiella sp.]
MADHPPESPDPTAPLDPAAAADPAFVAYVATCAEAIAAGQPPPPPPTADLSDRCARVRSTLRLLDRVRRTAAPDSRPTILGDDPPTTPWTGAFANARIGRYELIRELGRGGMGMVYLARDPDLDRTVALKVIAGAGTDRDRWLARFRAEGRILARLDHPNIVRVYKAGEADGSPFLVMEHVAGPSLHSHLGGRPMPPRDAAGLVEVVARGVDYAHRQGVIHRDLKPANILLENDEFGAMNDDSRPPAAGRLRNTSDPASRSSLTPKVTDFGLATPAGGGSDLTRTGELIGTPGYLAPEVIAGGAATGPEVDIYGLGAVLYECLTGRPAFAGTNLAVTLMLIQHTNSTPPRKLNPAVPRDLETICLACMRKDPARRYRSAAAVADDLAAFLTGRPIQARPVGAAEAVLKWARRSPAVAALSAATALTLVAGTAVSTYFAAAASARAEREAAAALAAGIAEDDARKAHAEAVAAKEASDLLAARLRFQDAVRRAEAGEVEVGLFGMADALRLAPACPAAADFRRAVRLSFAAWGRQFPVLRHAAKLSDQPLHKIWVGPVGPDGSVYAAWCPGQPVRLLDAATGRPAGEPCELPADERPLVLSPDGGLILTRAWDERSDATIRLRRLQGGAVVGVPVAVPLLPVHQGVPDRESFVLSARVVMTGGADSAPLWGPRRFWDLETGTAHPLVVSDKNLAAVRLLRAADGRAIVVVVRHSDPREGADVRAEFWDVATGKPLEAGVRLDDRSDPHVQGGGRVVATVFGDDAGCTAGADGSVAWWEVGTGRLLGRWRPNRDAGLSFLTSDGQTLVAFSADERVRLYDPDTGLQRGGNLHLPEGAAPRLGIVAVPGNPVLATLDGDGVLRGWAIGHPERQATAAARPRAGHPGPGQAAAPYSV